MASDFLASKDAGSIDEKMEIGSRASVIPPSHQTEQVNYRGAKNFIQASGLVDAAARASRLAEEYET